MERFKYLDHTADAKFEAYGNDLEEAFINSAHAMFSILIDTAEVKPAKEYRIKICAKRKESLLFDFLDELLFLLDTEGFLLSDIRSLKIMEKQDELFLECTAVGDQYNHYEVKGNIKAITYNEMEIVESPRNVKITAVVDL